MAIRVDPAGRLKGPDRLPFFNQVIERVEAVPGVESAAMTIHVPMGDRPSMGWDAIPQGREHNPATDNAAGRIVSPGYFETVGIRMLEGRDFDSRDVRPNPFVMAINETFARRIRAEGGDPLRTRFLVLGNVRDVVAVVSDVKHRTLDGETTREAYIPMGQAPTFFQSYDLVVRADDPIALVPSIRDAIWAIDRNQALGTPVLLEEYIGRTLRPRRLLTGLIGVFAATTLLLAAFGVYGVVGYRVSQRMKEVAIRVALGAPRWRVTGVVLRDAVTYVGLGLVAGLPLVARRGRGDSQLPVRRRAWRRRDARGRLYRRYHGRAARRLPARPPRAAHRPDRGASNGIVQPRAHVARLTRRCISAREREGAGRCSTMCASAGENCGRNPPSPRLRCSRSRSASAQRRQCSAWSKACC